jgi:hypothetical protein
MANDAKAEETISSVRDAFSSAIREAIADFPAHQALQLADRLCTVQLELLAGMRVTYRRAPDVDGEAIAEDWRRGLSIGEITLKHGVSRPTAYKYHPNKTARAKAG